MLIKNRCYIKPHVFPILLSTSFIQNNVRAPDSVGDMFPGLYSALQNGQYVMSNAFPLVT